MSHHSKYSYLLLLCIAMITLVVNTRTKPHVKAGYICNRVLFYEQSETKQINDLINYFYTHPVKASVEVEKSYKLKHFFTLLGRISSPTSKFKATKTIKNQLSHFQADYPISYYIYSLHRIIT